MQSSLNMGFSCPHEVAASKHPTTAKKKPRNNFPFWQFNTQGAPCVHNEAATGVHQAAWPTGQAAADGLMERSICQPLAMRDSSRAQINAKPASRFKQSHHKQMQSSRPTKYNLQAQVSRLFVIDVRGVVVTSRLYLCTLWSSSCRARHTCGRVQHISCTTTNCMGSSRGSRLNSQRLLSAIPSAAPPCGWHSLGKHLSVPRLQVELGNHEPELLPMKVLHQPGNTFAKEKV
jgi:hypothetical protein